MSRPPAPALTQTAVRFSAVFLALLFAPRPAAGFGTDFGGSDFKLRFDNTLRGNLGVRVTSPDPIIGANPAFSAGEYSFGQGHIDTGRLDLLTELDLSYRSQFGGRASFASWFDGAYRNHAVHIAPSLEAQHVPTSYGPAGSPFTTYTNNRYLGPYGEFLDAFLWTRLDLGDVPVTIRGGRHTIYWGESLLLSGAIHGVSYAQEPLDLMKAFANPGTEAKELYRPLAQVSANVQLTPALSLAGQYFFEWQSYLYPEGATFLGPADFAFNGPLGQFAMVGGRPFFFKNDGSRDAHTHDWGTALRYNPEFLGGGIVGVYYRHFADKLAAVLLGPNPGGQGPLSPTLNSPLQYQQYYGEGIDLVGVSFAKQILGVSTAIEGSYRHNMPLAAQPLGLTVAPSAALAPVLFPHGAPKLMGNTYQARGDTVHVVGNAIGTIPNTPLWSIAAWNLEGTYSRWLSVDSTNQDMFFGEGYGVCRTDARLSAAGLAKTTADGCATRNSASVGATFTPTWYQVFSGVDLLMPLTGSATVWGNSPVTLGGNVGSGTYAGGLAADIYTTVRIDLKYVGFFGQTHDNGTVITNSNGLLSLLKNRESVVLTAKVTL